MAVVAKIVAEDVVGWLGFRIDAPAERMTSAAIERRALEDATNVTGLAIRSQVRTVEHEACSEVVE